MNWIDSLETFVSRVGKAVSWLNLLMVAGTLGVVLLRYLFNIGSVTLQESVMYLHAIVFMLGMALTFQWNEHVRVDVLYQGFGPRARAWVNLLGGLFLLLPLLAFIAWESLDYVSLSWRTREASQETGGLPFVYLLKTLIPLMVLLLTLQALADLGRQFNILRGAPAEKPGCPHD